MKAPIRFCMVGLANSVVGFGVIAMLLAMGAGDFPANAAGYVVGLILSFALNRTWTFEVRGAVRWTQVGAFLLAFGLSYLANLVTLGLMRRLGFEQSLIGQGAAMATYSAGFFMLSRHFVFRPFGAGHTS